MKTWFRTLYLFVSMMWIFFRDILSMWRDIPNAKGVDYSIWWGPEDELDEADGGPDPEEDVEGYGKNASEAYAFAMANELDFDTQRFMDNWLSSGQSSYELLELVRVGLVTKQEYTEAFKKYLDVTYFSRMPKAVNRSAEVVLEIPTGDQDMLVKHFFEPKEIVNPNRAAFEKASQEYKEKRDAIINAFGMIPQEIGTIKPHVMDNRTPDEIVNPNITLPDYEAEKANYIAMPDAMKAVLGSPPKYLQWNYQPILETGMRIMGNKIFMNEEEIGEINRVSNTGDDVIFYGKLKNGMGYES